MAANGKTILMDQAVAGATVGDIVELPYNTSEYFGILTVSVYAAGLTPVIQHSADKVTWFTLKSFVPVASTGNEIADISKCLPFVRVNIADVAASATIKVELSYKEGR